jgi:hypothetical protein
MRDLRELDRYRERGPHVRAFYGFDGDETCGMFLVPSPIDQQPMAVVASCGEEWRPVREYEGYTGLPLWDHVSVSRKTRAPNWQELDHIYRLFFRPDETAMQLHVPKSEHVNTHPHCLHLWRPIGAEIPKPPAIFV